MHTLKGLDILEAVKTVSVQFTESQYHRYKDALKGFQILEGVYTFLAYLAFVNNKADFYKMSHMLDEFIKDNDINTKDILQYKRFGRNYLLSLPLGKKVYYVLSIFRLRHIVRILTIKK